MVADSCVLAANESLDGNTEELRIFVGCSPNGEDAESQQVLIWSLMKWTPPPWRVIWMKLDSKEINFSDWNTSNWPTPFSGFRWAVPELCDFKGKAIYSDSDVIFLRDLRGLWDQKIPEGKGVLAKSPGRLCVSLWDCKAMAPHMKPISELKKSGVNHTQMVSQIARSNMVAQFKGNWNCLDGEAYKDLNDPDIKAIHYTYMPQQPHLPYARRRLLLHNRKHWFDGKVGKHWRNDLIELFETYMNEAEDHGIPASDFFDPKIPYFEYSKASVANIGPCKHRPN